MQEGLIFLGIRLHNFGPMYLMECLPCVVVLNLCMANSLFLSEYLVSVIWRRSAIYFGQMCFFVLYIETAISCNRLLRRVHRLAILSNLSF